MKHAFVGFSALLADIAMCLNWYRLASSGHYCCVYPTLELPDGHVLEPGVVVNGDGATPEPDYERFRGAPNFIADVHSSELSAEYVDRRQRFAAAGVQEYLAVFDTQPLTWRWHSSTDIGFELLTPDDDGIIRSVALPGLWFPESALSSRDWWTLMATITRGVTRQGHHDYMHKVWHPKSTG